MVEENFGIRPCETPLIWPQVAIDSSTMVKEESGIYVCETFQVALILSTHSS